MKDIIFACPRCKQALKVAPDEVGQSIECPTCKLDFTIPTPTPLSQQKQPSQPTSDSHLKTPPARSTDSIRVVVTDIKIPFWSLVTFMVNLGVASIPALIILIFLWDMFTAFISGLMGTR